MSAFSLNNLKTPILVIIYTVFFIIIVTIAGVMIAFTCSSKLLEGLPIIGFGGANPNNNLDEAANNDLGATSTQDVGQVKDDCAKSQIKNANPNVSDADAQKYVEWANKYGKMYGMDPALLLAQLQAESTFDPKASSGLANGIAQFTPATWSGEGYDANGNGNASVWEPEDAIASQARYMSRIKNQKITNPNLRTWQNAVAGYNAGPATIDQYGGIPPYPETRIYVNKIFNLYNNYYSKCL